LVVRAPEEHLYRAVDFSLWWRWVMFRQRMGEGLRPPWRSLFPQ
jgi:hypothetical protein